MPGGAGCYGAHLRLIPIVGDAAKAIGEEILREDTEESLAIVECSGTKLRRTMQRRSVKERSCRIDFDAIIRIAPCTSWIKILKREADWIDHSMATGACRILA